jgi:predicted transcriptional regulator
MDGKASKQEAYLALANSGLGLDARRVLDILLARLDFENWIHLPQSEIAAMLNMQRSHVSRAMRDLEKVGVILRGPKVGRSITYRINPNFGWKGSAKNHNAALNEDLKERMKERGMSVVPADGPEAG